MKAEPPVSVGSVYGDSDCVYSKMISLSLLTEIFTTSDQFCKKFIRRDASILASLLRNGYIRELWYPGLSKLLKEQKTCEKCGDRTSTPSRAQ